MPNLTDLFQPFLFFKVVVLITIGLYAIFTIVVVNQIKVMNSLVAHRPASLVLQTIVLIQMIAAILLFVFAIVIL